MISILTGMLLLSCGVSNNKTPTDSSGTSITYQLKWPTAKSVGSAPAGVANVRMSVSAADMTTMSSTFPAATGSGSISNVPVGSGRTITFQGLDASSTLVYQASKTNATLVAGQPYDCGVMTMTAVAVTTVPAAPSGLSATAVSSGQINLAWVDNSNNESSFVIERKTGVLGTYTHLVTTSSNANAYSDTTLSASTNYYYRVRSTNSAGYSGYAAEVNATTPADTVTTYSISGAITSGGSALTGVTVSLSGSGSQSATNDSSGNYTFSAVPAGSYTLTPSKTGYTFTPSTVSVTVSANLTGQNFTASAVATSPTAPSGLTATAASSSQINLAWVDNSNNETGFKIERKTGAGGTYAQIGIAATNATSYNDTGLSALTNYYYHVRATNSVGDSGFSAEANATTAAAAITTYIVTPSAGANGTLSPSTAQSVNSGSSTSFSVTPNSGYSIASVSGCSGSLSGNTYTTEAITGACTVTASFTLTPVTGTTLTDPTTGMTLLKVTGGTYTMGDTFGDGYSNGLPTHQVTVGDFYIGKYEVTQAEWQTVMGSNPSYFTACGTTCPVEQVSWTDIQTFISTLNTQSGKTYRLPTEAEWEYAARSGGQNQKYSGTSDVTLLGNYAWYGTNAGSTTHPVGQKQANGLGLYDMSGNVWEWVSDWYGAYSSTAQTNPTGATTGSHRVNRGGSGSGGAAGGRASGRGNGAPGDRNISIGFRLLAPVQ
jgi:formylglycine-generating enzyme required for sulfatase activity